MYSEKAVANWFIKKAFEEGTSQSQEAGFEGRKEEEIGQEEIEQEEGPWPAPVPGPLVEEVQHREMIQGRPVRRPDRGRWHSGPEGELGQRHP